MPKPYDFRTPKNWELALALMEQIRSYREAARAVQMTPEEFRSGYDPETLSEVLEIYDGDFEAMYREYIEKAEYRLSQPVVDLEDASRDARAIAGSGGWGAFVHAEAHPFDTNLEVS